VIEDNDLFGVKEREQGTRTEAAVWWKGSKPVSGKVSEYHGAVWREKGRMRTKRGLEGVGIPTS